MSPVSTCEIGKNKSNIKKKEYNNIFWKKPFSHCQGKSLVRKYKIYLYTFYCYI